MLLIIYSILISYMLFFTTCIAPVVNTSLDQHNSSRLLRKIFPKNFIFGLTFSVFALFLSILQKNYIILFLSVTLAVLFLFNLKYLMPKINLVADLDKKKKKYSKKFKRLHLFSVILYLLKMLISILGIILLY